MQSGSVDITNLNTREKPAENVAYFKQETVLAAKNLFSAAVSALELQPSIQKIVIMNQTPRYDEAKSDPMALKPALAQLYNSTLVESWIECIVRDKIVLGVHNLDCIGGIREARYRDIKNRKYDGVHMYGPSGRKAYTISVLDIMKSAELLDNKDGQIKSGQDYYKHLLQFKYQKGKTSQKHRESDRGVKDTVNDRDVRKTGFSKSKEIYGQRYTVSTSNFFDHLNC